jgi:hypothetical protein
MRRLNITEETNRKAYEKVTLIGALGTGPTGHAAAGSGPAEDGGILWVIKIPSFGGEVKP